MARLQERSCLFSALDPEQKNAARFAGYLAQWVDIGFQRPALVKQVVSRFPTSIRSRLPLCDYLHLHLAEGMIAMAQEATDDAIHHLDFVLSLNQEIQEDKELRAIANFWKRSLSAHEGGRPLLSTAQNGRGAAPFRRFRWLALSTRLFVVALHLRRSF